MKLLRADPATENTPLLALGANAAPEAITKALEAGFFHYLTKPLRARAVHRSPRRSRWNSRRWSAPSKTTARFTSAHSH